MRGMNVVIVAVGVFMLSGCDGRSETPQETWPPQNATVECYALENATFADRVCDWEKELRSQAVPVSKEQFGDQWPFIIDSGQLACTRIRSDGTYGFDGCVVFLAPDGTRFGVNGLARNAGYDNTRPIRRMHPDPEYAESGIMVDIGPLIQFGLSMKESPGGTRPFDGK